MPTPLLSVTQEEVGPVFRTEDPAGEGANGQGPGDARGWAGGRGLQLPREMAVLQRVGRGVRESATAEVLLQGLNSCENRHVL